VSAAQSGIPIWRAGNSGPVLAVDPGTSAWSPDGKLFARDDYEHSSLYVFDTSSLALVTTIHADSWETIWSPDSRKIAVLSNGDQFAIYDSHTGQELYDMVVGGPDNATGAWTPDGSQFITVDVQGEVQWWDGTTGQQVRKVSLSGFDAHEQPVSVLSPDQSMLIAINYYSYVLPSGLCDRTARIVNIDADQVVRTISDLDLVKHGCPSLAAWSPDGTQIAIAYNLWDVGPWTGEHAGAIALYDVATGQRIKVLNGHASLISSLAFSPDGKLLASGSEDGTAIVWDVAQ
jgi:WD40 repeat protein